MACESYDAIVIGGGHNGLVAAAYLARSGAKTLVLEARNTPGGAATTELPWPDAQQFKVTRLSYVMSLLPPTILNDLKLEQHGYKVFPMGPYYQAFQEGGSLTLYEEESQRAYDEIAKWSKKDADAYPKWNAWLGGLADVLGPLLLTVPPNLGSRKPRDLAGTLRLAWRHRGLNVRTIADVTRLMTMSIADLLDDWFESPQVKGALAVNGVIGTWAGPYEPGTAYVMAHHSIGDVGDGRLGSWGFPEGGMGAVAAAVASSARSFGVTIRTGARVAKVTVAPGSGRATGVVLANGDEITAKVIVTSLHPKTAFIDAREGRPAARPFSDGVIPTAFDKTLAPEGYHIMSLFTQWVPATWNTEPHREELEKYADRVIDTYNEVAPNFKAAILHRDVVGPYDMEHDYGLIGGNIFHGELSLEQLFHLRPAPGFADYRTPVPGLYYASSATHAGGGVCGIPGMQAAKAAIADRRASRSRSRRDSSR
jgi:phytoene dehydrogenase-like protein